MYPVFGTIPVDIHPACASSFGRSVTVKKKLSGRGLGENRSRSRGVILCPCSDSAPEELRLKCLPHSGSRSESGHYSRNVDKKEGARLCAPKKYPTLLRRSSGCWKGWCRRGDYARRVSANIVYCREVLSCLGFTLFFPSLVSPSIV